MKLISSVIRCTIAALIVTLAIHPVIGGTTANGSGPNWPQWRGPSSQGISTDKGLPSEWSGTKNIQWKTPIPGRGHSSPIVWGRS